MDISTYKNPRIKTKEILFLKTDFVKKHLKILTQNTLLIEAD